MARLPLWSTNTENRAVSHREESRVFLLAPLGQIFLGCPPSACSNTQGLENWTGLQTRIIPKQATVQVRYLPRGGENIPRSLREQLRLEALSRVSYANWPQTMKGRLGVPGPTVDRDSLCGSSQLLLVSQDFPSFWGSCQPQPVLCVVPHL